MKPRSFFILISVIYISLQSCKKDSFINSPDARLRLSTDSIKFDTVFVTAGSVSQVFKIVNENNQKLLINSVKLMGGAGSAFKTNINGVATTQLDNIELAANDSMYVFVTVYVNPNAATLPFILSDSISVNYNGNTRFVQLQAYGQNAIFLNNKTISSNTTWTNSLPYVILGGIRVTSTATLSILPGCKIYSHANAPFIVDGTMIANGTITNKILFTGDRLDEPYKFFPSSWPGIYFRDSSRNNEISFGEILNAYQAVLVDKPSQNANPKLLIKQTLIDNAYNAGILCNKTKLTAENCLVSNCGNNIVLQGGGDYSFTHCTTASYSTIYLTHKAPVLTISDFTLSNGIPQTSNLNAIFRNSIFWGDNGSVTDEIAVGKQGTGTFNVNFDHCLYKAATTIPFSTFIAEIKNQDPAFDSIDLNHNIFNFRITKNALAPGTNKGIITSLLKDLDNNNRNVGLPDLGCYEKQ
ncbi:MAG: hypothetical protein ABIY51_05550 [Ferruginibacter sp.]